MMGFIKRIRAIIERNIASDPYFCVPMPSVRQEKFASLLKSDLATILQKMTHSHFEGNMLVINDIEVSADFGVARIYLGFLNAKDRNYVFNLVNYYNKEIRHQLAQLIRKQVRKIPELHFFIDDTLDQAMHIEKLLQKIKQEEQDK